MLNLLDQTIRNVLDQQWAATPPPARPGFFFTVPDEEWRNALAGTVNVRLNVYLYEVRENRDLRRAEWDRVELPDGSVATSAPPAYFDCHYLISAWSPAEDSEALNPILDEHQVLGEALRIILANPEVRPVDFGVVAGGPVFTNAQVYLSIATPESTRVLNDFWTSMRVPWRAAIPLVATAPIDLLRDSASGPRLTTFVQRLGMLAEDPAGFEERILIGGFVLNDGDGSPIPDATVSIVPDGPLTTTDNEGRFSFSGLRPGITRLRAEAPGFTALERNLDLPAAPAADHIFRLS